MNPKHIVLLKSHLAKMGGAEKYALRLASFFKEKTAVTILSSGPTVLSDISILTEKCSLLSFLHTLEFDKWCTQKIKELNPDVIFGLDRNRYQTHIRASNGVHAAYLEHRAKNEGLLKGLEFKINPLHRILLKLEKEGFEHPGLQKLFTNSHMVKEEILKFYNVSPQKIEVIHNGVEWQEMQKDFDLWPEKKDTKAPFQFLFLGHNYRRKGLDKLLLGLSLLKEKEWHLSVVGKEKNIEDFVKLAKKLALEKKVTFFGQKPNIKFFYQIADCLVIPSFYDPFANVTVEALAMGLFVVSSKTNGGHEIINKENGAVIEDLYNPESIAASLAIALEHPKTRGSSQNIRNSVKHLDFATQLPFFYASL